MFTRLTWCEGTLVLVRSRLHRYAFLLGPILMSFQGAWDYTNTTDSTVPPTPSNQLPSARSNDLSCANSAAQPAGNAARLRYQSPPKIGCFQLRRIRTPRRSRTFGRFILWFLAARATSRRGLIMRFKKRGRFSPIIRVFPKAPSENEFGMVQPAAKSVCVAETRFSPR